MDVRKVLFIVLFGCCFSHLFAQKKQQSSSFKDNLFFGGGLYFSGGNVTALGIEPSVGVYLTEKAALGVSAVYRYYESSSIGTAHSYGGGAFINYGLIRNLYASLRGELLRIDYIDKKDNEVLPAVYIGGGYMAKLKRVNGRLYAGVRYNLLDVESKYYNTSRFAPVINFYF